MKQKIDWNDSETLELIKEMIISGKGYAEISEETGLPRSTVSSYCQKNGIRNLLSAPVRGNTVHAGSVEKQSVPACKVTVTYAEKPNEVALADALKILMNVR